MYYLRVSGYILVLLMMILSGAQAAELRLMRYLAHSRASNDRTTKKRSASRFF
jgi:hypothetical protein